MPHAVIKGDPDLAEFARRWTPLVLRRGSDVLRADQVYLEQLEWQIVHSAQATAQRYIETVVLPAVERAERAGGAAVA